MAMTNLPSDPNASQPYSATARPMSAAVPIGARRMIHHRTFWIIFSSDSVPRRNGSAGAPTFTAAMPSAMEMTSNCRTLNTGSAPSSVTFTPRPRMLSGTTPARNAHHEPVDDGASAAAASTEEPMPGLSHTPMRMPATTDARDVAANH